MTAYAVRIAESAGVEALNGAAVPLPHLIADRNSLRYETLVELSRGLNGLSLDDLASHLAARLRDAVEFDVLHIAIPGDDPCSADHSSSRSAGADAKIWIDEAQCQWVLNQQQPLRLGNTGNGAVSRFGAPPEAVGECRSFCGVPLPLALRRSGALCLATRSVHAYSDADERFLVAVADRVALAVDGWLERDHMGTELSQSNARGGTTGSSTGTGSKMLKLPTAPVRLGEPMGDDEICEGIVGRSVALRNVLTQLETVAPTDSTVLICGETGTGKELIARALHNLSMRRGNALVKCNCAAIPTGLLESELFGHEKGAFTGAVAQRIGRFELANRGTIFLDEIGETPLELQPKLLRVLQEREFERLGNSRTLRTDARLVAATNVKLQEMVDAKRFRADLFYRLNVFPIVIPPLRERPEDIPVLVRYFADDCAKRMRRAITCVPSASMDALLRYSWPGNIRELQNLVERAVILSSGDLLEIPLSEIDGASKTSASQQTLEEAERAHILATLKTSRWVLSGPRGAANRLGLKRSTLQFRMKKLGIERPRETDEATH